MLKIKWHIVLSSLLFTGATLISSVAVAEDTSALEARVDARIRLAAEYYGQQQLGNALQELLNAKAIYEDYAPLQNLLGVVNMDLKRYDDAETAFKRALRLDKNNPDTHNNYGWFLCKSGHPKKSYEWLQKAIDNPLYSSPEKALYNAGRCARMDKDNAKALTYFNEALARAPKATAIMFELADMQFENGQYGPVLDILDRINEMAGKTPQTLWLALRTEYRLGHMTEVDSYGSQLVRKYPNAVETTMWLSKMIP